MSIEENKATVERFFAAFNASDLGACDACFPDVPRTPAALAPLHDTCLRWHTAFPDYHYVIDQLVAEDDRVAACTRYLGTHTGIFAWQDYGPWKPTGKELEAREQFLFWLVDGKIVNFKAVWNPIEVMQQLGIAPPLGAPVA